MEEQIYEVSHQGIPKASSAWFDYQSDFVVLLRIDFQERVNILSTGLDDDDVPTVAVLEAQMPGATELRFPRLIGFKVYAAEASKSLVSVAFNRL